MIAFCSKPDSNRNHVPVRPSVNSVLHDPVPYGTRFCNTTLYHMMS